MTKGEIEDVLSSIRRLVSDGSRPMFRAAPRPFAREAEKLILTPALRVLSASVDDRPPSATRFALTEEAASGATGERPSLGTVITAIAAAVPRGTEGWEPEAGDPVAPLHEDEGWIDEFTARRMMTPGSPDLLMDALRPLPASQGDLPEPPALPWQEADDDGWDAVEPVGEPVGETMEDARPADLFAVVPPEPEQTSTAGNDAVAILDPEVLTEMIREVLREELRGPFGERITSNLRRLVRVEIARALSLRGDI